MKEPLKEPRYGSGHPLYFCVVFGKEGKNPMLGVVDESAGTDAGYDVAYVDENMNGDLTDDSARKFARVESGSRAGELSPRFEFEGPFEGEESAKYKLNIYSLAPRYRRNIKGRIKNSKSLVSAGLKDINGCTLRIVRQAGKTVSPTLTIIKDGKIKTEEKMKFG